MQRPGLCISERSLPSSGDMNMGHAAIHNVGGERTQGLSDLAHNAGIADWHTALVQLVRVSIG